MKLKRMFIPYAIKSLVFITLTVSSISAKSDTLGLVMSEKYSHLSEPVTTYIKPPLMTIEVPSCNLSYRYDASAGQQTFVNHTTKQILSISNKEMENFLSETAEGFEKTLSMLRQIISMSSPDQIQELEDKLENSVEETETEFDQFTKCLTPEAYDRTRNSMQNFIRIVSADSHSDNEQSNDYETSTGEMNTVGKHNCVLNHFSLNGKIIKTACVANFEDYAIREQDVAVLKSLAEHQLRMEKISTRINELIGVEFAAFSEQSKWEYALSHSNVMVLLANKDDIGDPFTMLIDIIYQEVPDTVFDIPTNYKTTSGAEIFIPKQQ